MTEEGPQMVAGEVVSPAAAIRDAPAPEEVARAMGVVLEHLREQSPTWPAALVSAVGAVLGVGVTVSEQQDDILATPEYAVTMLVAAALMSWWPAAVGHRTRGMQDTAPGLAEALTSDPEGVRRLIRRADASTAANIAAARQAAAGQRSSWWQRLLRRRRSRREGP